MWRDSAGEIAGAIEVREREWADAVRLRDIDALERILGAEFVLVTGRPGAETRTRHEYLSITRDRYCVKSFSFDELSVDIYGNVAVVRSRYSQTGTMDGEDRSTSYRMTDIWLWRDQRWQAVTRHLTPVLSNKSATR